MKKLFLTGTLIAVGLFVAFLAWRERGSKIESGEFKNKNILLITLDTTRADRLPVYGYKKLKTPHLDRLARQSYVFDDAISHVPLTLPAHASILTGMLPIHHGVRDNSGFYVDQSVFTLPEILKANGYRTSAFVSAFVLDSQWQLDQGFDLYYDHFNFDKGNHPAAEAAQRPAEETVTQAIQWLKANNDAPFFSWVHFYDPHEPYDPPEPYKSEYRTDPYDGEIAYMDGAIGKLLNQVSDLQLQHETIVIVTADHGEGLGEHQEDTHALFVYDTTQRVPLIIQLPGKQGARVTALAQHSDLLPTILDLLGIAVPGEVQGKNLIPCMNGQPDSTRVAYIESLYPELHYGWSPLTGLVTNRFKYIDAPRPELYDRVQDPAEIRNLIKEEYKTAQALKGQLKRLVAGSPIQTPEPRRLDQASEERLRALGYIGSGSVAKGRRQIDPKDRIHLARALQAANVEAQAQRYEAALRLLMPVMKEDPEIADAHFTAGVSYLGLNKFEEAIEAFEDSLALRPDHTMSLYNLGYVYELKGEEEAALDCFLRVVQAEPEHFYANAKIAHLYRALNQPEKAGPYFLQMMNRYQQDLAGAGSNAAKSSLHASLGEAYFGAGDLGRAETHIQTAIQLAPATTDLHYNLGSVYEAQGKVDAAMKAYQREIELNAGNYKAFNNLGLLYQRTGQLEQAEECFKQIIQLLPGQRRGYLMLASLYEQMGRAEEAKRLLDQLE